MLCFTRSWTKVANSQSGDKLQIVMISHGLNGKDAEDASEDMVETMEEGLGVN